MHVVLSSKFTTAQISMQVLTWGNSSVLNKILNMFAPFLHTLPLNKDQPLDSEWSFGIRVDKEKQLLSRRNERTLTEVQDLSSKYQDE